MQIERSERTRLRLAAQALTSTIAQHQGTLTGYLEKQVSFIVSSLYFRPEVGEVRLEEEEGAAHLRLDRLDRDT